MYQYTLRILLKGTFRTNLPYFANHVIIEVIIQDISQCAEYDQKRQVTAFYEGENDD